MKKVNQTQRIAKQLLEDSTFMDEIRNYVQKIQRQTLTSTDNSLVQFAFEKRSHKKPTHKTQQNLYPWSLAAESLPIQGMELINEINTMFVDMIENNLHNILNREFMNVTNQILAMREEIDVFTKDQDQKNNTFIHGLQQEIDVLKKKVSVQQTIQSNSINNANNMNNTNSKNLRESSRNRGIGNTTNTTNILHSNSLSNSFQQQLMNHDKKSLQNQIAEIKKTLQILKKGEESQSNSSVISERIVYLDEKVSNEIVNLKVKMQALKQKQQKSYQQLASKVESSSNKEQISGEVKRSVKSNLKIYLDEINQCKLKQMKFQENMEKLDKGLQEYVGNQLKSCWMLISNIKRRVEEIEESINLGNQSFIMQ